MTVGAYSGELMALGALVCWAVGAPCFEAAGKRVGAMSVNLLRLILAFAMFFVVLWLRHEQPIPLGFSAHDWGWLLLSGLVGFALGDLCLFEAFVEIGPRLSLLLMSLSAPLSAVLGWMWLGEQYGAMQWMGIAVTLTGVGLVILERPTDREPSARDNAADVSSRTVRRVTLRGVLLGVGGAVGQAVGSVMSKLGMGAGDAMAATQIRVIGGILGLAGFFFLVRWWKPTFAALQDQRAMMWMTLGTFFGVFLGVWFYLRALQLTTVGVVATIVSLLPVAIIPLAIGLNREHVSHRAVAGALIAFWGVVMLISPGG